MTTKNDIIKRQKELSLIQEIDQDIESINEYQQDKDSAFHERAKLVKKLYKDFQEAIQHLKLNYKLELNHRKEDIFPREGWMLKNKKINEKIEAYPLLCPILNFIFNRNRKAKDHELESRVDQLKEITSKIKKGHTLSVFIPDKAFYTELASSVGCSSRQVQTYVSCLCRRGILHDECRVGRHTIAFSDGYFSRHGGMRRKNSWITNSKDMREKLKNFTLNLK